MYFYIDESGQTGLNLFDADQPFLYYGVLSSKIDLDTAALDEVKALRQRLGVDRLHASELGNQRLVTIVKDINKLNKNMISHFLSIKSQRQITLLLVFLIRSLIKE